MKSVLVYERRLQDLERQLQNAFRIGKIKEVKFENRRWFVRLWDGDGAERQTFKTDWVPWKSFAHGSIAMSVPPRVGQSAAIQSPGGYGELSYCEPYHYNPDHPSPHNKQDEIFIAVQAGQGGQGGQGGGGQGGQGSSLPATGGPSTPIDDPLGYDYITLHATKDMVRAMRGPAMFELTKDTIKVIAPTIILKGNQVYIEAADTFGVNAGDIKTHASGSIFNGSEGAITNMAEGNMINATKGTNILDADGTIFLAADGSVIRTGSMVDANAGSVSKPSTSS